MIRKYKFIVSELVAKSQSICAFRDDIMLGRAHAAAIMPFAGAMAAQTAGGSGLAWPRQGPGARPERHGAPHKGRLPSLRSRYNSALALRTESAY
jgi:hypothetical protein